MRKLSSLVLSLVFSISLFSQSSPHGADFKTNCMDCHNTTGWKLDIKTLVFNHSTTKFPLIGQHQAVNCLLCHKSLEFARAGRECVSCHTDMHNQTLGTDCGRCHTPNSWVVNNITEMHQRSRFPLVGAHVAADCFTCHKNASSSLLNFAPLGINCIDCHQKDFDATTNPKHTLPVYANCVDCHKITAITWAGAGINHDKFPLTGGHNISNCQKCHLSPNYADASPVCVSCHQDKYNATTNPNHVASGFSTGCIDCHTTEPGWKPATYAEHELKFPIYSGKHRKDAVWTNCIECHNNPASYAVFTCIDCHDHYQPKMDAGHGEVQGYAYNSPACFACHPTGNKEGSFNHNTSQFPLTGAHITTECIKCHAQGYTGTSIVCYNCHTQNYTQSVNPDHVAKNIPNDCGTCHTTLPTWKPATFPIHNNYYVLTGAHLPIANDCATCHNGNYATSSNTCFGCHAVKYNQSTNPNHITANFPTTCETCHSQVAWSPSTFNHANVYPLTGAHATIAGNCFACHQGSYVNTPNTCAGCHMPNFNATTNPNHVVLNIPSTCNTCHTTNPNWTPATFPIHNNYYVLAGAHIAIANNCNDCHNGNYNTAPNTCVGCHQTNYNQTNNPPHAASQFPTTCTDCHTQTAWSPSNWDHDGLYFPIYSGKHNGKWNTCADCHTNPANYAVFTCTTSCHPQASMNSKHQGISGYSYNSAACYNCHPTGNAGKMMNGIDRKE